jgi:hypothetical protein
MNLSEFKAWFEGFTESMEGAPSEKAWERIKGRVKEIKDAPPVERHHFHDYYVRPWKRYWDYDYPRAHLSTERTATQIFSHSRSSGSIAPVSRGRASMPVASSEAPFDSRAEFNRLGRAEALSLTK